jgi:hypothetical protein
MRIKPMWDRSGRYGVDASSESGITSAKYRAQCVRIDRGQNPGSLQSFSFSPGEGTW